MSAKTNAEVVIDGKVYTLSGYENEEYLQKVAAYINNKIAEFDDMDEYKHLPGNMKSTLIESTIDKLFGLYCQAQLLPKLSERRRYIVHTGRYVSRA